MIQTINFISYGIFYNNKLIASFDSTVSIPYSVGEEFYFHFQDFDRIKEDENFVNEKLKLNNFYVITKIEHSMKQNNIKSQIKIEPPNVFIHITEKQNENRR